MKRKWEEYNKNGDIEFDIKDGKGKIKENFKNGDLKYEEERKESLETIKNENYFCCSKCRQRILISLNPNDFSLSYKCQNNHEEPNIKYNKFYNENYINKQLELLCQQCKQEKLNYNNILTCKTCHIQLLQIAY